MFSRVRVVRKYALGKGHRFGMQTYRQNRQNLDRQNAEKTKSRQIKCRTDKISTDKMPNRQNVDRQNACDPMRAKKTEAWLCEICR